MSLLAGCYCSHEREGVDDASLATDARESVDAAEPTRLDAWSRPCEWRPVETWQLTDGPGDQGLNDVVALDASYALVTGSQNDPPAEPGRFVHRVTLRAPVGERQLLLGPPLGAYFSSVALARGGDRILATTWDDAGCRAHALSLEGSVMGETLTLPLPRCVGPIATDDGFAIFDRPGDTAPSLHTLSIDGTRLITTSEPIESLRDAFWWSRARLGDGTFLVAGMHDGVSPTSGTIQHLDRVGQPLGDPMAMPTFAAASRVRLTHANGVTLAAWLEQRDGDHDSQERALRVVPIDDGGRATGPVQTPSTGIAYRDGGMSSAAIASGFLFAFVESERGDRFGRRTSVVVVRTNLRGERQEEIRVSPGEYQRSPVIRARGDDALVAFTATNGGLPTNVWVGGIECR